MITGATDRNHTSASGGQQVGAWVDAQIGTAQPGDGAVGAADAADPFAVAAVELPRVEWPAGFPGGDVDLLRCLEASYGRGVARAVGVVLQVPVKVKRQPHLLRAACSVDLSAMKDEKTSILYPLTVLPRSGRVGRKHQERSVAVLFDLDDDFCHRSSSANAVSEGPEPVGRVE